MKKDMYDLAEWSIKTAQSAGADDSRVGITNRRFVNISYRERKPETIKEATTKELYLQIYKNGRYSSQTTSDLRKDALKGFIANAITSTKLLAEDPYRSLPDPKYYQGRADINLEIYDPQYRKMTAEDRHAMVKAIEEACYKKGGDKVITVTASEYDSYVEYAMMTSNGFDGYMEATVFQGGASMSLQDEGDRRPMGYNYMASMKKKDLPSPAEIGAGAAKRTQALLGGKKLKTETLPIIIENRNVPRILGGFVEAMYAYAIQQKQSFLADKKGHKIASEHFTIIDDPFIKSGLGSQLFDDDGFAAKKRVMVDKGVLKDFYVDWYYGRKLGWEPTSGGPSNIIIPPGKRSVKEIMKDLGRGIFISGFIGGNSNSTTGDASVGIIGQLFENGEFTQAVAEMNIAGNHLDFWNHVIEAANDPYPYSSWRTPSLVFEDMVVAGI
jgi:PmbA protein